ncbi:MAG TPA: TraB/GumN family protein [Methanobacterium sp.]|nr:TraB/GumN family protein [Methanobacterium sp.]
MESEQDKTKSLKIIGTAHVSQKSIEEVKETIREMKPDVVAVELDLNRYQNLKNEASGQQTEKEFNIREIIKSDQLTMFLVSGFLSYMQKKIGEDVGVKPGSEMMAAVEAAEEVGAKVALIDRDIQLTLKRALNQMSFWEKAKFAYGLLASLFTSDEDLEDIEKIKEGDTLAEVMEYFQDMSPKAYHVLVDERDAYMARMLLDIPEGQVVAVVGAGHKNGIKEYMDHPDKIPPISELVRIEKSRISITKVLVFAIPAVFVVIFLLAFINGVNINSSILNFVLLTGGLGCVGSLVAGSKVYSALTALLVAPVTAIHPLLAAGWFAGIVEAKLRKVSVEDMAELPKCDGFRDLWKNKLFRVLLVVVGANIGTSIGTFIAIPNVLWPLVSKLMGY